MVPADQIAEAVQDAQDKLDALQEEVGYDDPDLAEDIEEIEEYLEALEDTVEEEGEGAEKRVQEAQDSLNALQDEIGYEDPDLAELIEQVEEEIEGVEDLLAETGDTPDEPDDLVVEVNEEEKDAPDRFMTALEIVRLFDYDPDNVVLYKARDIEDDSSREGDQFLPRDEEIDLQELNKFACLPSETPYGSTTEDSTNSTENEALNTDIERLREEYEVDIKKEGNFTQVIVRDWSIPSDAYSKDETDVMIRVPQGYPQQHPDWVYVDDDLRLADGGIPKKHNRDRVDGWLALSWHLNNMDDVAWVPYETDLKWYLDTICDHRLRRGE